jgi:regulator of protease activity HflC (stomatin/prohibitin superfamily)
MFLFVIGFAALLVGLLVALFVRRARGYGVIALLLGLCAIAASTATQVPAQSVGVVTSFGRPIGTVLNPGLHFKAPWHRVNDMDGTIQLADNIGANGRTTVRLSNNSLMYVENAFRWKIQPAAAPGLFLDWRKNAQGETNTTNIVEENVAPGLVTKELAAAINVALSDYDPLRPNAAGQTTDELAKRVIDRLNTRIGDKVQVVSFTILRVDFDDATQARQVNFQEEVARTRTAQQREKTAEAEARANRALAASVSKDPNVLVARCLDTQRQMVEKGQSLLGVASCWPGGPAGTVLTTPTK